MRLNVIYLKMIFIDFPNPKYIVKEKMNMLLINNFKDDELNNIKIDNRFQFVNRIGGLFACTPYIASQIALLYENMLNKFDKDGVFKGKEQTLWNFIYITYPQLFYLTPAKEHNNYDKWYYLHYLWSEKGHISNIPLITFNIGNNYKVYHNICK